MSAIRAETDEAAAEAVKEFLASRTARRVFGHTPDMVEFERQREWLEGLAKYTELVIGLAGQETPGY